MKQKSISRWFLKDKESSASQHFSLKEYSSLFGQVLALMGNIHASSISFHAHTCMHTLLLNMKAQKKVIACVVRQENHEEKWEWAYNWSSSIFLHGMCLWVRFCSSMLATRVLNHHPKPISWVISFFLLLVILFQWLAPFHNHQHQPHTHTHTHTHIHDQIFEKERFERSLEGIYGYQHTTHTGLYYC